MANVEDELLDEDEEGELNIGAIIFAAIVILAILGGAAWYFLIREEPEVDPAVAIPKWETPEDTEKDLVYEGFERFIISPLNSNGRYYLIAKIDISYGSLDVGGQILSEPWILPKARNRIIDVLSSYTVKELQTYEVKRRTRQVIKDELNAMLGWDGGPVEEEAVPPIKGVYFVEYIIQ